MNARKLLVGRLATLKISILLVVVGFFASEMMSLADPPRIIWQEVYIDQPPTSFFLYNLQAAAFGGGTFVAVGDSIMASTNGADWTKVVLETTQTLNGVIYGAGRFVAVGGAYVGLHEAGPHFSAIVTSTDGYNWTNVLERNLGFHLADVTYGKNQFVAVGNGGGSVMVSSNGIAWTQVSSDVLYYCNGVAFGNGKYVLVGNGINSPFEGVHIMTSEDGVHWTKQQNGYDDELFGVCYGNGYFVACGGNGTVLVSVDGITWTKKWNQANDNLWRVAPGEGVFVCPASTQLLLVGDSEGMWSSQEFPEVSKDLSGIAYGNGQFVAVGERNLIIRGRLPPQAPTIANYTFNPDHGFVLNFGVQSNRSYRIEVSDDLISWKTMTNLTAATSTLEIRDETAATAPRRFYRAVGQ